jgi:hypothetical protein
VAACGYAESHFETFVDTVKHKTRELTTGAVLKEHKAAVQAVERERQIAAIRAAEFNPSGSYALVASLCPGSKCEFVGREQRKGITVIGAEKDRFKPSRIQGGGRW